MDGEVEERPAAEDDHSAWQCAICSQFSTRDASWNIRIRPSLLIQTSATRYRVADVAILDRALPISQIARLPPLAVFEVLSPEDRVQRLTRKLSDYATMGVGRIWVIDPKVGTFSRFEDGHLVCANRFILPDHGIDFATAEIAALVR